MNEEPLAIPERYSFFLRNIIKRMLDKDPSKRPSILQIFEFLEVKQEVFFFYITNQVNKLISEYPQVYKDFEPLQFGKKKVKLELEIREYENHQPQEKNKIITPIEKLTSSNNKGRLVSSTKNQKISENSIFSVIEKVKAKSNGTTPQYEVPNFFTMGDYQQMTPLSGADLKKMPTIELDYNDNKKPISFTSPSNISNNNYSPSNPSSHLNQHQKRRPIISGGNQFDHRNLESPSRQLIARNFLKEKLGDVLFQQIVLLRSQNQIDYPTKLKELQGEQKKHLYPVIEYVMSNTKPINLFGSPSSNDTPNTMIPTSQNSLAEDPSMTFGNLKLSNKRDCHEQDLTEEKE